MKRFGDGEEGEMESINVANVLILLSRGGGEEFIDVVSSRASSPVRVFECKTCSRQFPSFQALGGHRASHKKPRLPAVEGQGNAELLAKPRAHECSICGLEFAIGQALGGHMRRHRAATVDGVPHALSEKKKPPDERRDGLWLDLNLPPASEEERDGGGGGCRRKVFGFELVDTTPAVVDYFH